MVTIAFEIPIKTVSEANCSEHWTKKAKRHRSQQYFIRLAYNLYVKAMELPCHVTLTRLSPRLLDADDNLPMAFKWIKDELSECIFPDKRKSYVTKKGKLRFIKGRADSDPRVTWRYAQEKGCFYRVRIEIEFLNTK